ncbi:MAG: hypothetical protein OES09_13750 [Gammaproteobacteria bacterium]|nr:hypothetical protein [Gammaproteobacteria bacterium]
MNNFPSRIVYRVYWYVNEWCLNLYVETAILFYILHLFTHLLDE